MSKIKPDQLLNWISIGIRLIFLTAVDLRLHLTVGFTWRVVAVMGAETLAVIISLTLAGLSFRTRSERIANVLVDMLFAYLIYYFTLPTGVNMGWVGLLPVITAALNFRWLGMIAVSVANLVIQGSLAWNNGSFDFVALMTLLALYGSVGALLAAGPALLKQILSSVKSFSEQRSDRAEIAKQSNIFKMISALSSTLNYLRVLEMALDLASSTLSQMNAPAGKLRSAVLLFTQMDRQVTELQISINRGLLPQDVRITLPGTSGLLGRAVETGQSQISKDVNQDPELSRFVGLHKCQSVYIIPLRIGLDTYGILLFAHPETEFFREERLEILDIVGNLAMVALQNARLYQDLAQEKERLAEIEEESRKKLARDLHDGPTQSIAAIAMRVNFVRRLMERDPKAASEELFKIEELARRTTKEIRHMLFTLRPLVLETQGLIPALESMAEKVRDTFNQQMTVQAEQSVVDEMETAKQAVVFYIVEEAVNNVRKHAQAEHIWVRLKMLRDQLGLLEIEDDGVGFSVSQVDSVYGARDSMGLVNMRERTELVNGVFRVESTPGHGTRVQVVIPLSEEAQERLRHGK